MSQITLLPYAKKINNSIFYICTMYCVQMLHRVTVCLFIDVAHNLNQRSAAGKSVFMLVGEAPSLVGK